jgi:hypothetical protein
MILGKAAPETLEQEKEEEEAIFGSLPSLFPVDANSSNEEWIPLRTLLCYPAVPHPLKTIDVTGGARNSEHVDGRPGYMQQLR